MDKHIVRQEILVAVNCAHPGGLEAEPLFNCHAFIRGCVERETILSEARGLVEQGYLDDMRPGRAPLFRITARGKLQLPGCQEADLDEYIYGKYASKFARPTTANNG